MNWASQLSPHHRLIFPLRVPASPLRCLLFHRDEMRHYWLIRRDKENYLMHIQKINRNKAWYDTLKGKLFPQHIIKWDSADFFFHICFHFWLMFPDNLQHKYTTDNILRWQMHDNLCYLFHLCIHPAVFFMHFNSIQISNNKKKIKNTETWEIQHPVKAVATCHNFDLSLWYFPDTIEIICPIL